MPDEGVLRLERERPELLLRALLLDHRAQLAALAQATEHAERVGPCGAAGRRLCKGWLDEGKERLAQAADGGHERGGRRRGRSACLEGRKDAANVRTAHLGVLFAKAFNKGGGARSGRRREGHPAASGRENGGAGPLLRLLGGKREQRRHDAVRLLHRAAVLGEQRRREHSQGVGEGSLLLRAREGAGLGGRELRRRTESSGRSTPFAEDTQATDRRICARRCRSEKQRLQRLEQRGHRGADRDGSGQRLEQGRHEGEHRVRGALERLERCRQQRFAPLGLRGRREDRRECPLHPHRRRLCAPDDGARVQPEPSLASRGLLGEAQAWIEYGAGDGTRRWSWVFEREHRCRVPTRRLVGTRKHASERTARAAHQRATASICLDVVQKAAFGERERSKPLSWGRRGPGRRLKVCSQRRAKAPQRKQLSRRCQRHRRGGLHK